MTRISFCKACYNIKHGIKTRLPVPHTCVRSIEYEKRKESFLCKAWWNNAPCDEHCGDKGACVIYPKNA